MVRQGLKAEVFGYPKHPNTLGGARLRSGLSPGAPPRRITRTAGARFMSVQEDTEVQGAARKTFTWRMLGGESPCGVRGHRSTSHP